MKTLTPVTLLLALCAWVTPTNAQLAATSNPLQSLRVLESNLPVFPQELLQLGVREGEVRVAFSVDATGKMEDCLVVAYTHKEFARVTMAAVKRWKFEPARFNGQPIAAASEVEVKFEVEGTVVVSLTPNETVNARIYSLLERGDSYRPRTLRELDRIPTPIAAPSPAFPARLAKSSGGVNNVTVSFYIDESGAVRMPSVGSDDDPDLAAAAIDALRNWKFEPPTCKGKPVLVRASQQFNFRVATRAASNS